MYIHGTIKNFEVADKTMSQQNAEIADPGALKQSKGQGKNRVFLPTKVCQLL